MLLSEPCSHLVFLAFETYNYPNPGSKMDSINKPTMTARKEANLAILIHFLRALALDIKLRNIPLREEREHPFPITANVCGASKN